MEKPNLDLIPKGSNLLRLAWNGKEWELSQISVTITNKLVRDKLQDDYFLANKQDDWYILYHKTRKTFFLVHEKDQDFLETEFISVEEAKEEIEIIEGRKPEPKPVEEEKITSEEEEESRKRWDEYLQAQRDAIADLNKRLSDFWKEKDARFEEKKREIESNKNANLDKVRQKFQINMNFLNQRANSLWNEISKKIQQIKYQEITS